MRSSGWFEDGSTVFIAMEYLRHGDLQRHLMKPLPEREVRQIALQLAEGLDLMHKNNFVHRDLKPLVSTTSILGGRNSCAVSGC